MYHLHNLYFVLSLFDNAACTDWLTKLKRYRVYVTQDKQCSMTSYYLNTSLHFLFL